MESDLTRVHCSAVLLGFLTSSNEELLSDDDDASAPETQSDGNFVWRMAVGVLKISLFNLRTAVAGRVTLPRPTVIAKEIALLSRVFSVAATEILLLACSFPGTDSALAVVRFSLHN